MPDNLHSVVASGPRSKFGLIAENVNDKVAASFIGRWFRLDGCGHPLERKGSRFVSIPWTANGLEVPHARGTKYTRSRTHVSSSPRPTDH
jgi:hypothetical protein